MSDVRWELLGSEVVSHRNRWEAEAVVYHGLWPKGDKGRVLVHIKATAKAVASIEEKVREAAFNEVYTGRRYEDTVAFMKHPAVVALERATTLLEECLKEWG